MASLQGSGGESGATGVAGSESVGSRGVSEMERRVWGVEVGLEF